MPCSSIRIPTGGLSPGRWAMIAVWSIAAMISLPAQNLRFEHLTPDDGLIHKYISAFVQDRTGYLWIGTTGGLDRYDGYRFRHYRHDAGQSGSLPINSVSDLCLDGDGNLWVATLGGGLCRYLRDQDRFEVFRHDAADPGSLANDFVKCVYHDARENLLWVGTHGGVSYLMLDEKGPQRRFHHFGQDLDRPGSLLDNTVNAFLRDSNGELWIGMRAGLNRLESRGSGPPYPSDLSFRTYRKSEGLGRNVVYALAGDPQGRIWVGTTGGISLYHPETDSFESFFQASGAGNNMVVFDIEFDERGYMWMGTYGQGLLRLSLPPAGMPVDPERDVLRLGKDDADRHALNDDNFYSLYLGRDQVLWAGSETGGVNYAGLRQSAFRLVRFSKDGRGGTDKNVVTALSETSDGKLWIGLQSGGMVSWDRRTGEYRHFPAAPAAGKPVIPHPTVIRILESRSGELWIGTFRGLARFDPATGTSRFFLNDPEDPNSLSHNSVFSLYEDRDGRLWIGTRGGGLNRYDPQTDTFHRYRKAAGKPDSLQDDQVWHISGDRDGMMWLATDAGLARLDPEKGRFRHFRSDPSRPGAISSDYVNCIHQDRRARLWVGTGDGGLNLFDPETETFRHFDQSDGLPDDMVYTIVEDGRGDLWMSSNRGLFRLAADRLDSRGQPGFLIEKYDVRDGLQDDEFNFGAAVLCRSGEIAFGGMRGFNIFHPDSIRPNPYIPPVVITGISVMNEPLHYLPGQKRQRLNGPVDEATQLDLGYRDNMVEFEFAALSFLEARKNRFAYRLEGFDEDWVFPENRNFATYTNLAPGEYLFRVKAANNDGVWNETGAAIRVVLAPPPWRTWWAYTAYGVALLLSVIGFIRWTVRRKEKEIAERTRILEARAGERERVRRETAADFHDELGSRLTRIAMVAELARLRSQDQAELSELLEKVQSNSRQLSEGFRDFLWLLDPESDSLFDVATRIKDFGDEMFLHAGIAFRTEGIVPEMRTVTLSPEVRRHLVLIFKEALHNALKYAGATELRLDWRLEGTKLAIGLQDNGQGFRPDEQTNGQGLRNMAGRAKKIGAEFHIESDKGKGTRIRLIWTIPHMGD